MDTNNLKSYLKFEVIWKDDEMFELKVHASNTYFYGVTEVYDTSESLNNFARKLISFPKNEKNLIYEIGKKGGYSFCSIRFYQIDSFGHVGVEVTIESNVNTDFRIEEKNKLKLEILVEPNAIENFQKALSNIAIKQKGIAILYGSDNRIDN